MRYRMLGAIAVVLLVAVVMSGCTLLKSASDTVDAVKDMATEQTEQTGAAISGQSAIPEKDEADTSEDEEAAASEDEVDVEDIASLDSYRQLVAWTVTEDEETQEWSSTTEFVRDPASQRVVWRGVDNDGNVTSWEMIQIGTITYMRTSGEGEEDEWMSMTSDDAQPPQQQVSMYTMDSAETYLNTGHCDKKGRDDVEGQSAMHYVCDKEVYGAGSLFWMTGGTLTDGGMELWISDEFDVQVRSIMWWEGKDEDDVEYAWHMEEKVWDINEPFTIEAPEGVAAPGLPDDVPLPADAAITSAMSGMVSFEVEAELDAVLTFYADEMPANGWTLESQYEAMLTYNKDGRQAMIMLTQEDAMLSGVIMITEP